MTQLEKLVDYANNNDIEISEEFFYASNHKGCCMVNENSKAIMLNKASIDCHADELCVLAEEVGHIETGTVLPVGDYLRPDYIKWVKRGNEIRAGRWAFTQILPAEKIQAALDDCCSNNYEIAEYCGVTEVFLHKAVEYHKGTGVIFRTVDC